MIEDDYSKSKESAVFMDAAIGAVLSIICAVIILMNPFSSSAILWTFTAIFLIVEAIFDIVIIIMSQKSGESTKTGKAKS